MPEGFRDKSLSKKDDGANGLFWVPCPISPKLGFSKLKVIVSDGMGWDHVSVSLPKRTPTWEEMCYVKDLFFDPDETVVQFHPSVEHYVNLHPNCLHLWRNQIEIQELPPIICV